MEPPLEPPLEELPMEELRMEAPTTEESTTVERTTATKELEERLVERREALVTAAKALEVKSVEDEEEEEVEPVSFPFVLLVRSTLTHSINQSLLLLSLRRSSLLPSLLLPPLEIKVEEVDSAEDSDLVEEVPEGGELLLPSSRALWSRLSLLVCPRFYFPLSNFADDSSEISFFCRSRCFDARSTSRRWTRRSRWIQQRRRPSSSRYAFSLRTLSRSSLTDSRSHSHRLTSSMYCETSPRETIS